MSGNEQIKIKKIVLIQLAKITRLNKVFKLVSRISKVNSDILKGILSEGNLSVTSLDQICGKYFVDLHIVAKINSHEVSKGRFSTKTLL